MKVVLELQEQLANVRRVTVRHDIVIGRGSDCNLRLSAPQMSRRHCFLRVGRDGVSVTDLDSSNGTYVDNKRITPGERIELKTGSILSLGPVNFIVHLKEDSGSPPKSEGERSRSRSKPSKPSAESSTIVSSAAAIIAEESKGKTSSKDSAERTGASTADREKTARTKGEPVNEASSKRQKSSQDTAKARDGVAVDTVKKAATAAAVASLAAPVAEELAKPDPVSPPPMTDGVGKTIDADVESPAAETSWLTDDSPDDLSFFGGQPSEDAAAPLDATSGSEVVEAIEEVVAVDDVVAVDHVAEEVVEVLDEDDIFAGEVVEAALVEEPVEAVEVLEDEPEEVVEVLEDEAPSNAITADLDESDLFSEQFIEVVEEPQVIAEEVVAAELVEEIEEPAEVVEVLEDHAPVEVLQESNDFFDQLGIVEEEPPGDLEQVAVVDAAASEEDVVVEVADSEWFDEPAEVVEVLNEVVPVDDPVVAAAAPELNDAELVDVLEEPSDFFESLGVEAESEQAVEEIAGAEAVEEVEAFADVSVEAEAAEEPAPVVEVLEEAAAVELLEEPSDFFDSLGIEVEPEQAVEEIAGAEAVEEVEAFADVSVEAEAAEEPAPVVEVLEEAAAVELLEEPSDFFDSLGIEVEPEQAVEEIAAAEVVEEAEAFSDVSVEAEPTEESAEVVEVIEEEATVELLEEPSDFFDSLGIEVEPERAIEGVAAVESDDASEADWFSDAVEEVVDVVEEQPAAAVEVAPVADAPVASAELESATAEESADVDAEIEVVEEFDFFDDVEATDPAVSAEDGDAEVEEVTLLDAAIEEDVAMTDEEIVEEVVDAADEDEGSNWFSVGDDKGDDDDDRALREFLKGF